MEGPDDERVATLHQRILPRHYQNDFTHGGTRALLGYHDVEEDRLSVQPNNEVRWPITLGALRSLHITLIESTRATLEYLPNFDPRPIEDHMQRSIGWYSRAGTALTSH